MRPHISTIRFLALVTALFASLSWCAEQPAVELVNPTATPVRPSTKAAIDKDELLGHIQFLSSGDLRGREAGTPDQLKAAAYVADEFKRYGLEPYGDEVDGKRGYFQTFSMTTSKGASNECALKLKSKDGEKSFSLHKDFSPFPAGEKRGVADGGVVFAGYGIVAPELNYDDFGPIDLAGKWALILRYEPQERDPQSKFSGTELTKHSALNAKILNCALRRAAGVLIVTGPAGREKEPEKMTDSSGPLIGDFKIPVFQITRATADALLAPIHKTIGDLQAGIDKDLTIQSCAVEGAQLSGVSQLTLEPKKTSNIIARLVGKDAKLKDEYVVIGAHCDHVGMGAMGSMLGKEGRGKMHPGADDNASGTAGLLEIAQYFASLKPEERPARSILFMAFSGEEEGLLGSYYYLKNPEVPVKETIAMLNLDMIGRSLNGAIQVAGIGTSKGFKDLVQKYTSSAKFASDPGTKVHLGSSGSGPSDHAAFCESKIPVLFFFTGLHPDYHRPSDTWDKINAPMAAEVADLAREILADIANNPVRPEFAGATQPGFLGVAADTKQQAKGYWVGQVVAGSPAEAAGLKAGDQITVLNGQTLSNAMDLSMGLIDFCPGDVVDLSITRGGEKLELKVKLGSRKADAAKPKG